VKQSPQKIKRVYVTYKRTVYEKYVETEKTSELKRLIRKKHFSIRSVLEAHQTHTEAVSKVTLALENLGIIYGMSMRHEIKSLKRYHLILTVGGDGTFLRSAHWVKNQLIMGINSSPHLSVGALCSVTINDFEKKLTQILAGRFHVRSVTRIQIRVNGKVLPVEAVNDILFTNNSPAATSRYYIHHKGQHEEHKSSGIWIASASGSTAVISALGGLKMKPTEQRFQFVVREPYQGIYHPYHIKRGIIFEKQKLKITSKMIRSRLYIDGPTRFFNLRYGDEIEFTLSKNHLNVVV
jgi:NAD+ kinase